MVVLCGVVQDEPAASYRAHGLDISSQVELPAFEPAQLDTAPDLNVRVAPYGFETGDDDRGEDQRSVVASAVVGGKSLELLDRPDGSWLLGAEGIAVDIDAGASTLNVNCESTADTESAMPWLIGGLGIAAALMKRGSLVLHASMFSFGGVGHLVMAPSGYGKSLVTAAACASGATLVAEDTVRIETDGRSGWMAYPGSSVLRTRRTIDGLVGWFGAERVSRSSDDRALIRLDPVASAQSVDRLHLIALDPEIPHTQVGRVADASAVPACLGHVRVPGLVAGPVLDHHFDAIAALVSAVPLDVVQLPWSGEFGELTERVRSWLVAAGG